MEYPNWFAMGAQYYFNTHLFLYADKSLKCLQIGAYTGDATCWLFENILRNPNSTLTDVDTWEGSDEPAHHDLNWQSVEQTYDAKTLIYQQEKRLVKRKMTSDDFFKEDTGSFDFIYIDGDHKALSVLKDASNAITRLNPKGILAFDDYTWSLGKGPEFDPKPAIDAILVCAKNEFTVLEIGHQVWLQKN